MNSQKSFNGSEIFYSDGTEQVDRNGKFPFTEADMDICLENLVMEAMEYEGGDILCTLVG
jgi:hypothetical protein